MIKFEIAAQNINTVIFMEFAYPSVVDLIIGSTLPKKIRNSSHPVKVTLIETIKN